MSIMIDKETRESIGTERTLETLANWNLSNQESEALFAQSPVPIAVVDFNLNFRQANRAFAVMLGYEQDELLKLSLKDISTQDEMQTHSAWLRDIIEERLSVLRLVKRLIRKDRTKTWVSNINFLLRNGDGQPESIMCVVRNIVVPMHSSNGEEFSGISPDKLSGYLGTVIQVRRLELGLSQEELAERSGLHRTYISDVECGSRNVTLKTLERLATGLKTRMSSILDHCEFFAQVPSQGTESQPV